MIDIPTFKLASLIALLLVALLILRSLLVKSRDDDDPINLDDLLLERGPDGTKQISKIAAVMFAAFVVTSWVLIYQTLNGTLSDALYGAYLAAWVAPMVTAIIKRPAPPQEPQT